MDLKENGIRRDEPPQQGVFDPISGKNITGEYTSSAKQQLEDELKKIFTEANECKTRGGDAVEKFNNLRKKITSVITGYYSSLKLPPNEKEIYDNNRRLSKILGISSINLAIEDVVKGEYLESVFGTYQDDIERDRLDDFHELLLAYSGVYLELKKVGAIAQEFGLTYEITTMPILSFEFGWVTKLDGLWITFYKNGHLNSTLLGLPISELQTSKYGPYFLGGEPPAAELLRVNEKILLFVSQDSVPPGEFLEKIQTKENDDTPLDVLPMCNKIQRGAMLEVALTDPVCVDVSAEPSKEEILTEVFERMPVIHVIAIYISGYPNMEIIPRKRLEIF